MRPILRFILQSRLTLPVLLLGLLLQADAGSAQPAKEAAKPPPSPMVFFLAKGEPGACGPGCSAWIAAEGSIDRDAASRFKALLRRLGNRAAGLLSLARRHRRRRARDRADHA